MPSWVVWSPRFIDIHCTYTNLFGQEIKYLSFFESYHEREADIAYVSYTQYIWLMIKSYTTKFKAIGIKNNKE